jgi:hypothetical protein
MLPYTVLLVSECGWVLGARFITEIKNVASTGSRVLCSLLERMLSAWLGLGGDAQDSPETASARADGVRAALENEAALNALLACCIEVVRVAGLSCHEPSC